MNEEAINQRSMASIPRLASTANTIACEAAAGANHHLIAVNSVLLSASRRTRGLTDTQRHALLTAATISKMVPPSGSKQELRNGKFLCVFNIPKLDIQATRTNHFFACSTHTQT